MLIDSHLLTKVHLIGHALFKLALTNWQTMDTHKHPHILIKLKINKARHQIQKHFFRNIY